MDLKERYKQEEQWISSLIQHSTVLDEKDLKFIAREFANALIERENKIKDKIMSKFS